MRPLTTELKWICLFLFVPFISNSQHEVDTTELELVLLEKEIFETTEIKQKNLLLLDKSYLYKENGDFRGAIETLNRLYPQVLTEEDQINYFYELALNNYLVSDFKKAEYYLIRLSSISNNANSQSQIKFLHIKNLHQLRKWTEAEDLMYTFSLSRVDSLQLSHAYSSVKNMPLKSSEKAESLSRIIPGVGQMYAGKFLRGVTSSTIQLGLLGFAAYSFLNGFYFSGTLTGVSLFYVFYMGGARHAGYLANEYNKKAIANGLQPIDDILMKYIKKGMN